MKAGLHKQDQIKLKQLLKAKISEGKIAKILNVDPKILKNWMPKKPSAVPTGSGGLTSSKKK